MHQVTVELKELDQIWRHIAYGQHARARSHRALVAIRAFLYGCDNVPQHFVARAIGAMEQKSGEEPALLYIVGSSSQGADFDPDGDEIRRFIAYVLSALGCSVAYVALHFGEFGRLDFHLVLCCIPENGSGPLFPSLSAARDAIRQVFREATTALNEARRRETPPRHAIANYHPDGRVYFLGDAVEGDAAAAATTASAEEAAEILERERSAFALAEEAGEILVRQPNDIHAVLRALWGPHLAVSTRGHAGPLKEALVAIRALHTLAPGPGRQALMRQAVDILTGNMPPFVTPHADRERERQRRETERRRAAMLAADLQWLRQWQEGRRLREQGAVPTEPKREGEAPQPQTKAAAADASQELPGVSLDLDDVDWGDLDLGSGTLGKLDLEDDLEIEFLLATGSDPLTPPAPAGKESANKAAVAERGAVDSGAVPARSPLEPSGVQASPPTPGPAAVAEPPSGQKPGLQQKSGNMPDHPSEAEGAKAKVGSGGGAAAAPTEDRSKSGTATSVPEKAAEWAKTGIAPPGEGGGEPTPVVSTAKVFLDEGRMEVTKPNTGGGALAAPNDPANPKIEAGTAVAQPSVMPGLAEKAGASAKSEVNPSLAASRVREEEKAGSPAGSGPGQVTAGVTPDQIAAVASDLAAVQGTGKTDAALKSFPAGGSATGVAGATLEKSMVPPPSSTAPETKKTEETKPEEKGSGLAKPPLTAAGGPPSGGELKTGLGVPEKKPEVKEPPVEPKLPAAVPPVPSRGVALAPEPVKPAVPMSTTQAGLGKQGSSAGVGGASPGKIETAKVPPMSPTIPETKKTEEKGSGLAKPPLTAAGGPSSGGESKTGQVVPEKKPEVKEPPVEPKLPAAVPPVPGRGVALAPEPVKPAVPMSTTQAGLGKQGSSAGVGGAIPGKIETAKVSPPSPTVPETKRTEEKGSGLAKPPLTAAGGPPSGAESKTGQVVPEKKPEVKEPPVEPKMPVAVPSVPGRGVALAPAPAKPALPMSTTQAGLGTQGSNAGGGGASPGKIETAKVSPPNPTTPENKGAAGAGLEKKSSLGVESRPALGAKAPALSSERTDSMPISVKTAPAGTKEMPVKQEITQEEWDEIVQSLPRPPEWAYAARWFVEHQTSERFWADLRVRRLAFCAFKALVYALKQLEQKDKEVNPFFRVLVDFHDAAMARYPGEYSHSRRLDWTELEMKERHSLTAADRKTLEDCCELIERLQADQPGMTNMSPQRAQQWAVLEERATWAERILGQVSKLKKRQTSDANWTPEDRKQLMICEELHEPARRFIDEYSKLIEARDRHQEPDRRGLDREN